MEDLRPGVISAKRLWGQVLVWVAWFHLQAQVLLSSREGRRGTWTTSSEIKGTQEETGFVCLVLSPNFPIRYIAPSALEISNSVRKNKPPGVCSSRGKPVPRGQGNGGPFEILPTAGSAGKNPPALRETWVRSLGWEDPLEMGMATHSSFLAWRNP